MPITLTSIKIYIQNYDVDLNSLARLSNHTDYNNYINNSIELLSAATLYETTTYQLMCFGTYSNNTTQDRTLNASWSFSGSAMDNNLCYYRAGGYFLINALGVLNNQSITIAVTDGSLTDSHTLTIHNRV